MHEAGVKAFPAKTKGAGNQPMTPKIEKGVKIFELTCREIDSEVVPGQSKKAWAYNDQVPGPQIRVTEGDRVRLIVHNQLPESTAVHFHGLEVPNDQEGVPFLTQPPIKPGESQGRCRLRNDHQRRGPRLHPQRQGPPPRPSRSCASWGRRYASAS